METKRTSDLSINGIGASNGGQFDRVLINGKGTINSDVDCVAIECNGVGTVKGSVKAEKAMVNGKAKIEGNLHAMEVRIDGTASITEHVTAEKLTVSGHAAIGGRVKAEEVQINGRLLVGSDCEAEIFKCVSNFTIGGLLNADEVDIKVFGNCKVNEIGGQIITVSYKESLFGSLLKPFSKSQLVTDLIEGDRIDLENTSAKVVRGNDVKIGPDCHIGLVEYTGEITVANHAVVGETRKV